MMINIAPHAGFCPGVSRAVALIEKAIVERQKPLFCLGELIHNRVFNAELKGKGVTFISENDISSLPSNALVFIRAHGATESIYKRLAERQLEFIDATCPSVQKVHKIAATCTDCDFIIIGDKNHPEVQGIVSAAPYKYTIYSGLEEIKAVFSGKAPSNDRVVLTAQTTFHKAEWEKCCAFLLHYYPNAIIHNTICSATELRQEEVKELSRQSDYTIVVGSPNSSNSMKLLRIAEENSGKAHMVETKDDLFEIQSFFKNAKKILITAGASTPGSIIQEVQNTMANILNEEQSFEELLNASFKTLHTGDKVVGIVSAVSAAELKVDLGTKHTGILSYDEITDESGIDLTEKYHVGDEIEVVCIKFSDVDGTVQLSSKRLEASKSWGTIKEANETGDVLTGVVKDVIRKEDTFSGVVVVKGNSRVFIPASQTGLAKGESLEPLKGQKVSFKVIDINEERKRAVGSIKAVERAEKKQAQESFYSSLEVGQKFVGTVRAIMNYGAFVNIGPVDGMVHISELSYGRLRAPSEVLKVGQKLEVFIKSYDPETKRISLGHKTPENDPWTLFTEKYAVGDVVDATVVSLMPFGAFAEIAPELDGLIHNSQIAEKYVNNPASVLKVGDKVTVKIIGIDLEAKRINLSIKALLEPEQPEEVSIEEAAE